MRNPRRHLLRHEPHARGLPAGARVTVFAHGSEAAVWSDATGDELLEQPIVVGEDGPAGWVEGRVELISEWDGGRRVSASQHLRELASVVPLEAEMLLAPDAVEIAIGSTLLATVASPIGSVAAPEGPYGPEVYVGVGGFGVDPDGRPYWDPVAADEGEVATLVMNPFTLELTLLREEDAS